VIHACRALLERGRRPAILSRGYRAGDGEGGNDEARVIARWLPGVPHVQDPNRLRGGRTVAGEVDCFVLDDGFQHLPLARDADVVLVDATDPFGGGACPPGGRLREPLEALARADLVVLTRADLVSRDDLGAAMRRVRAATAAPLATARFAPAGPEPGALAGEDVVVACGIGNPRQFAHTVRRLGARVRDTRFFRDHHAYTAEDAAALAGTGLPVVVTEKDAVKLEPRWPGPAPLVVVRVELAWMDGAEHFAELLDRLCASSR